jgi:acetyltransferase-like isoleucine patch superfamily enzyme
VSGHENVVLGDNVHIGSGSFIRAEGGLDVGSHTHISRNLLLYTRNHDFKGTRLPYDDKSIQRPVKIGRCVWIGMNVCIVPGTTIGDGAIIGMGTTVSGTVPSLAIVASSKWTVVGERDPAEYERLDGLGSYGGRGGKPYVVKDKRS